MDRRERRLNNLALSANESKYTQKKNKSKIQSAKKAKEILSTDERKWTQIETKINFVGQALPAVLCAYEWHSVGLCPTYVLTK
ncbi:MAG: hypothetical protein GQ549_04640 [Gammaproteobacteria bacterium]|nr:hypothetical protein [Gammaproteobacteria bacterium]